MSISKEELITALRTLGVTVKGNRIPKKQIKALPSDDEFKRQVFKIIDTMSKIDSGDLNAVRKAVSKDPQKLADLRDELYADYGTNFFQNKLEILTDIIRILKKEKPRLSLVSTTKYDGVLSKIHAQEAEKKFAYEEGKKEYLYKYKDLPRNIQQVIYKTQNYHKQTPEQFHRENTQNDDLYFADGRHFEKSSKLPWTEIQKILDD